MALAQGDLTGKIIAAAIEVHKQLGPGFIESIYKNALIIELKKRELRVASEVEVPIYYQDIEIGKHRLDLLVEDCIVVELKVVRAFEDIHFATVRSYLHAVHKEHGLLINFSGTTVIVKRVISTNGNRRIVPSSKK